MYNTVVTFTFPTAENRTLDASWAKRQDYTYAENVTVASTEIRRTVHNAADISVNEIYHLFAMGDVMVIRDQMTPEMSHGFSKIGAIKKLREYYRANGPFDIGLKLAKEVIEACM